MNFIKIFVVVVAAIFCTTQADLIGNIFDKVTDVSKSVINTAVDAVHVTSDQIGVRNIFETQIVNRIRVLLDELKVLMFDVIPLLGLPRLEPYKHGHMDIDIKHEIGIFKGTMDDVVVTGLSKFDVTNVEAKIKSKLPLITMDPNITIDLHYDTLDITGNYDIKAYVGDLFNIYGDGPFALKLFGLDIHATVAVIIELTKQQIRIDEVAVDIKLKNMTCNFENLMGGGANGDLFNKIIGELAPEAVEVLWPEIRPGVEAKVKEIMVINLIPSKIRRLTTDLFHVPNINPITRIFGIEFR